MPPKSNNKKYQGDRRSRNFSLISYLDKLQIKMVLCEHHNHIKACAYIYHDKDVKEDGSLKEPHYHILLCLYNQRYESSVHNWFLKFENSEGDLINTTSQVCRDVSNTYRYLTHKNAKEKYQYSREDIKGINLKYFRDLDKQDEDVALSALNDLISGLSWRQLFQRYGRDAIYHINQLQECLLLIRLEEKNNSTPLDLIDNEIFDKHL